MGTRSTVLSAYYTPIVANDRVGQIVLGGQLDRTHGQTHARVYDRGALEATANMLDGSSFTAKVMPSIEGVTANFTIGVSPF